MAREIRIVFDGPPGSESGRFIEVEDNVTGESIKVGRWEQVTPFDGPDRWHLVIGPDAFVEPDRNG